MNELNHHAQCLTLFKEHFGDKKIRGVEVGTMSGGLTKALLGQLPNLEKLYTIDPWEHREGEQFEAGNPQEFHDRQKSHALAALKPYEGRVEIIQTTSDEAFFIQIQELDLDFVWIDGHHEESQVANDIQNGLETVRVGGIVGGHDYGLVPDVKRVVDEMFGDRVQTGGDFTWWIIVDGGDK